MSESKLDGVSNSMENVITDNKHVNFTKKIHELIERKNASRASGGPDREFKLFKQRNTEVEIIQGVDATSSSLIETGEIVENLTSGDWKNDINNPVLVDVIAMDRVIQGVATGEVIEHPDVLTQAQLDDPNTHPGAVVRHRNAIQTAMTLGKPIPGPVQVLKPVEHPDVLTQAQLDDPNTHPGAVVRHRNAIQTAMTLGKPIPVPVTAQESLPVMREVRELVEEPQSNHSHIDWDTVTYEGQNEVKATGNGDLEYTAYNEDERNAIGEEYRDSIIRSNANNNREAIGGDVLPPEGTPSPNENGPIDGDRPGDVPPHGETEPTPRGDTGENEPTPPTNMDTIRRMFDELEARQQRRLDDLRADMLETSFNDTVFGGIGSTPEGSQTERVEALEGVVVNHGERLGDHENRIQNLETSLEAANERIARIENMLSARREGVLSRLGNYGLRMLRRGYEGWRDLDPKIKIAAGIGLAGASVVFPGFAIAGKVLATATFASNQYERDRGIDARLGNNVDWKRRAVKAILLGAVYTAATGAIVNGVIDFFHAPDVPHVSPPTPDAGTSTITGPGATIVPDTPIQSPQTTINTPPISSPLDHLLDYNNGGNASHIQQGVHEVDMQKFIQETQEKFDSNPVNFINGHNPGIRE